MRAKPALRCLTDAWPSSYSILSMQASRSFGRKAHGSGDVFLRWWVLRDGVVKRLSTAGEMWRVIVCRWNRVFETILWTDELWGSLRISFVCGWSAHCSLKKGFECWCNRLVSCLSPLLSLLESHDASCLHSQPVPLLDFWLNGQKRVMNFDYGFDGVGSHKLWPLTCKRRGKCD